MVVFADQQATQPIECGRCHDIKSLVASRVDQGLALRCTKCGWMRKVRKDERVWL